MAKNAFFFVKNNAKIINFGEKNVKKHENIKMLKIRGL